MKEPLKQGFDIQTRAAHDDRQYIFLMQLHHLVPRHLSKPHGIEVLIGVDDIDQVVQNTVLLHGGRFGGAE